MNTSRAFFLYLLLCLVVCCKDGDAQPKDYITETVRRFIYENAKNPFNGLQPGKKYLHPDYVNIKKSGVRFSVITNDIKIVEIKKVIENINIINPINEELFVVTVQVRELLFVDNDTVKITNKDLKYTFYLSSIGTGDGGYKIIYIKPTDFAEFAFSEELKRDFRSVKTPSMSILYRDLADEIDKTEKGIK